MPAPNPVEELLQTRYKVTIQSGMPYHIKKKTNLKK